MSRTMTVGSFYNADSALHRLDPRVKLACTVVFMASVFLAPVPRGLVLAFALLIVCVALSRVPMRILSRVCLPLWPIVVITALANVWLVREGTPLVCILGFNVTDQALVQSAVMAFRVFALMMAGALFSLVTSPVAITDATERLLAPLERLGVPVGELAMMCTVAIRFMPILLEDARRIMAAQASRGAAIDEGRLLDRIRFFVPVLVPLFASSLRHAEELARAMEARCYGGGERRTHYHVLRLRRADAVAAAVFVLYLVCLVAIGTCC